MSEEVLTRMLAWCGVAQCGVLVASVLVPFRLDWRTELASLSRLHRQMYWVYGGYIVLSIVAFALISLVHAPELARGGGLARGFCLYVAVFWGVRLCLQALFDVREHLSTWWLRLGYHTLTALFALLTLVFGWAAWRPV